MFSISEDCFWTFKDKGRLLFEQESFEPVDLWKTEGK